MFKKDLVKEVSERSGYCEKDVKKVLDSLCETVADEVSQGNKVQITGFGTFSAGHRCERNFLNGVSMEIEMAPAKDFLKFKASEKLNASMFGE